MASLGSLVYNVGMKNRNFKRKMKENKKEVNDFEGEVDDSSKSLNKMGDEASKTATKSSKLGDKLKGVTDKAKKAGVALTAFAGIMTTAGFGLAKLASDAEETQSKFNKVFEGMEDRANSWAEGFADDFNQVTSEVQGWSAEMQDLLVPMGIAEEKAFGMSKGLTKLALDLGSFNNLPTEKVMRDLQAAMTGQSEVMKKYGSNINQARIKQIALNEGIIEQDEEMNELQKIQARYLTILQDTQKAQGDYNRTQDSFANQIKETRNQIKGLGEEIGVILLPEYKKLLQEVKGTLEAFDNLDESTKENIVEFGILATKISAVLGPLALLVAAINQLIMLAGSVATALSGIKMVSLALGAQVAGGVGAFLFLTSAISKVVELQDEINILKKDMKDLGKTGLEKRIEVMKEKQQDLVAKYKSADAISGILPEGMTAKEWAKENSAAYQQISKNIAKAEARLEALKKAGEQQSIGGSGSKKAEKGESAFDYYRGRRFKSTEQLGREGLISIEQQVKSYKDALEEIKNRKELSNEERKQLQKQYNDKIIQLEKKKDDQLSRLNKNLTDKKKKQNLSDFDYQMYLLDQEEQKMIDHYNNLIGGTEKFQKKKTAIEKFYNEKRAEERKKHRDSYTADSYEDETTTDFYGQYQQENMTMFDKTLQFFDELPNKILKAQGVFGQFKDDLANGLTNIVTGTQSASEAWENFRDQLIRTLANQAIMSLINDIASMGVEGESSTTGDFLDGLMGFIGELGEAHTGGVVTVNGVESFHTGGTVGMKNNERIIKTEVGETVLTEEQSKNVAQKMNSSSGQRAVNVNIYAADSQDVMRTLSKDGGEAVAQALGINMKNNGTGRQVVNKYSK